MTTPTKHFAPFKAKYDKKANSSYLYISRGKILYTWNFGGVKLDMGKDQVLRGIEITGYDITK